jgi:hypothetical protein
MLLKGKSKGLHTTSVQFFQALSMQYKAHPSAALSPERVNNLDPMNIDKSRNGFRLS